MTIRTIESLLIECRLPNTKLITTANHKKGKISRRPIRTRSKKRGKKSARKKRAGRKVQENACDQRYGKYEGLNLIG